MWVTDSFTSPFGETLVFSMLPSERTLATILMFPGFTSRRLNATNKQLAERLAPLGVRCVAFDLSGHGDSTGDIENQTIVKASHEIEAAISHVRKKYELVDSHPVGLVGNSFSANAAIVAAGASEGLSALALKSPVTDYVLMRTQMLGEEGMLKWQRDGYIELPDGTRSNYVFVEDAQRVDTYAILENIKIPVFAVHGSNDAEIPQQSRQRCQAIMTRRGMEYLLVDGGDHNLSDPYFAPVMDAMAGFITQHLITAHRPERTE